MMKKKLEIAGRKISLPAFVPDGTFGVVRSIDAQDLQNCGIQAVMMNTFHIMQKPGSSTIKALDGLHHFSGWEELIFTDSGGFQAYSLMKENSRFGQVNSNGISFFPEGSQRKFLLTPEKCIRLQINYGSNLLFCLDDCTHVDEPDADQRIAVELTIAWAKRCKQEFQRQITQKKIEKKQQPSLFGIVQGGNSRELRRKCADALLEIGFDGYGFGGWPLNNAGELLEDMVAYLREIIPEQFSLHALGIGHPAYVAKSYSLGYDLFDSAMPTRDARHGRLYRFTEPSGLKGKTWWEYMYINDQRHIKTNRPIDEDCNCHTCQHYSIAYLHHLYKINDNLFMRLATIHNLRFMTQLCERLRQSTHD